MATLPSNRSLIIPGKNALGSDYLKDMQTLEIWGRQPIQQLIAGSGITLSPSSGLATDAKGRGPNPVTISSSGGGGGVNPSAFADVYAGPEFLNAIDANFWPLSTQVIGPQFAGLGHTPVPCYNSPGGGFDTGDNFPVFGASWFTILSAGQSANIFPFLATPTFTGGAGDLIFNYYFWAVSTDFTNGMMCSFTTFVPSFTSQQAVIGDLISTLVSFGTDLTLTAGSGNTGNGLVSGGAGKPYFAGVNGSINTAGAVF